MAIIAEKHIERIRGNENTAARSAPLNFGKLAVSKIPAYGGKRESAPLDELFGREVFAIAGPAPIGANRNGFDVLRSGLKITHHASPPLQTMKIGGFQRQIRAKTGLTSSVLVDLARTL